MQTIVEILLVTYVVGSVFGFLLPPRASRKSGRASAKLAHQSAGSRRVAR